MSMSVTDYYPKYEEYWFIGRITSEEGNNIFTFKTDLNKLTTILTFVINSKQNCFWANSDYYGEVDVYLKQCFPTQESAMGFYFKMDRTKELDNLEWNEFPDPWEDK